MKKKTILCMILLCCTMLPVMAAEGKFYRDYSKGYKGIAMVTFEGRTESRYDGKRDLLLEVLDKYDRIFQETVIPTVLHDCIRGVYNARLTKEETFLLWSALHEYELSDGEMYAGILSAENQFGMYSSFMVVAVIITSNGTSCEYIASQWIASPY